MRRILDKAIMYVLVTAVVAYCVVQALFAIPDEIRYRKEVRRG